MDNYVSSRVLEWVHQEMRRVTAIYHVVAEQRNRHSEQTFSSVPGTWGMAANGCVWLRMAADLPPRL